MLQAGRTTPPSSSSPSPSSSSSSSSPPSSSSSSPTSALLEFGEARGDGDGVGDGAGDGDGGDPGDPLNPGVLSDLFVRVGGSDIHDASIHTMVKIHSGNVVGDNVWLWRADHTRLRPGETPRVHHTIPGATEDYHLTVMGEYEVATGIAVEGDDVSMYGLAVEHTTRDQLVWSGERGHTLFYQCELPYDVDTESFGHMNYTGYRVMDHVQDHHATGVGR
mmetsp:Transcript_43478/g.118103  ORF Transcript_43478/g.118103 Transcript_43478/m.118103 type:complete len:220 (+) Transcript_43478:2-661(+)